MGMCRAIVVIARRSFATVPCPVINVSFDIVSNATVECEELEHCQHKLVSQFIVCSCFRIKLFIEAMRCNKKESETVKTMVTV